MDTVIANEFPGKVKILFFDIETTSLDIIHRGYDLRPPKHRFRPESIIRDWTILGAAWAFNDEAVKCISVSPLNVFDDRAIVGKLHEILSQADIVVGHNSDNFDIKKFNARAIFHGFPPIILGKTYDTLKMARQTMNVSSRKLSFLLNYLKLPGKDESPDWDLILAGDREELAKMREYNRADVVGVRNLYKAIRPWVKQKGHDLNVYVDRQMSAGHTFCPCCGSAKVVKRGMRISRRHKAQALSCKDCGRWFTGEKEAR